MTDARLQSALDYIYSFVDYETQRRPRDAASYDLRRMDEILARVGNPHLMVKSVHIAGSKGKGSTSVMIASALTASGYKTGLYTSPHLLNFNERMQIDGFEIPDQDVVRLVDMLKPEVAEVNGKATYGKLTTFEIITVMGFVYFAEQKNDFNVVEVGLGGRLDATNVVHPEVCAITSLSLEHTDVLGNTLTEIATEKAGIIKPGKPVVTAPQQEEAMKVLERVAGERGSRLIKAGEDVTWEGHGFDSSRQSLKVNGRLGSYHLTIPLVGEYQLENAAVALGCLECLTEEGYHINGRTIAKGFASVSWPGRLQLLKTKPYLLVDGAHNPYSAARLAEALKKYFSFERATLIIGTSSDKDIAGIVSELRPVFNRVIVTKSIHPRALDPVRLVEEFAKQGVAAELTEDISVALPKALSDSKENDLVCVTGSLYVVAGAIEQFGAPGLRPRT